MKKQEPFLCWMTQDDLFYFYLYFRGMRSFIQNDEERSDAARRSFEQIISFDNSGFEFEFDSMDILDYDNDIYADIFLTEYLKRITN